MPSLIQERMTPVEAGRPDDETTVLCRNHESDQWWLGYHCDNKWWNAETDRSILVTHWMDLPEVP